MGLLQIGGGQKARCGGRVAGIDLGTTYSLVAVVRDGGPAVLGDDRGEPTLPSVVWFGPGGQVEVGHEARDRAADRPGATVASAKRFMGRSQVEARADLSLSVHRFADGSEAPVVHFRVGEDRDVTPMEVGAEVLKVLVKRAEQALEGPLDGVVITVPAYFDDAQRQATRDAARLAGLTVLRLLNEPTAAALAYGLDRRREGMFAVFDLGGGTFDISVLRLEDGVFQVLATGGDAHLGGDDLDRALAEHGLTQLGFDPAALDPSRSSRALSAARQAKEALTEADATEFEFEGRRLAVDRELFARIAHPVLERCRRPVERVLADCGLDGEELDGIVLVGGSTRAPVVRSFVKSMFGQEPLLDLDPDQVVALGAAVQADLLGGSGPSDEVLLLDVLPLSLGIETMGGVVEKILHRNQTIPAQAAQEFTTYADGQTGMQLHVVQGEREMVADCRSLARFELKGLPPMAAGMARVQVTFSVDADGILDVSAEETETKVRAAVEVKPSYGLDDETVERMILDAFANAQTDVDQRMLTEARVEARRILGALDSALRADEALLEPEDRAAIDEARTRLETAAAGGSAALIKERVEQLDRASAPFASRRMNESIRAALSGRSADDLR